MTETDTRVAAEQVTWCLTTNRYAEPDVFCVPGTDHDHYDVVLDQRGQALFRVYPVGTTWHTPDGYTMRLARYERAIEDMFAAEDRGDDPKAVPLRPVFDGQTANGGAFSSSTYLPEPYDTIVVYSLFEDRRPAVGSLYVRPNGESWRLRSYTVDWNEDPPTNRKTQPVWSVNLPNGAGANGDDLPSDARLVWHP